MSKVPVMLSEKQDAKRWPNTLSRADLLAMQWDPLPFHEFIIKVYSRCNLACDYCYMYELADSSWRSQPSAMTPAVATVVAQRIREHVDQHGLRAVQIVLHGGEPLLLGASRLRELLCIFEEALKPAVTPRFSIQTNGLLLTDSVMDVLSEYFVDIAVSLDGGRKANDRHRVFRTGAGSYDRIAERLRALSEGPAACLFSGFLATIDLANDPVEVYEDLRVFEPVGMDFLLPLATWDSPPPGSAPGAAPYADWLITLFDHWSRSDRPRPSIRLFDQMMALYSGRDVAQESLGLAPMRFVVVQTDGSYELVDSLRVAFDGASATGLDVFTNSLDELVMQPSIAVRQIGILGLSETCRECEHVLECGGGMYAHRYRHDTGFLNASVYCADMSKLLTHVRQRMRDTSYVS